MRVNEHDQARYAVDRTRFASKGRPGTGSQVASVVPRGVKSAQRQDLCRSSTQSALWLFIWNVTGFHIPQFHFLTLPLFHWLHSLCEKQCFNQKYKDKQVTSLTSSNPQSFTILPGPLTRYTFLERRASCLIFPYYIFIYFTNTLTT